MKTEHFDFPVYGRAKMVSAVRVLIFLYVNVCILYIGNFDCNALFYKNSKWYASDVSFGSIEYNASVSKIEIVMKCRQELCVIQPNSEY